MAPFLVQRSGDTAVGLGAVAEVAEGVKSPAFDCAINNGAGVVRS